MPLVLFDPLLRHVEGGGYLRSWARVFRVVHGAYWVTAPLFSSLSLVVMWKLSVLRCCSRKKRLWLVWVCLRYKRRWQWHVAAAGLFRRR